ncbi:hypothetical protein RHMOL_Rhmol13G0308400 [Rhododendron molle]|uniref:Uncharacterized protein n=1 Tax=Rhododendron molle TaxID=49168 RepID=A0ACC0LCI7_RHOML|nr:hypothetical protein RHMOL_Rhmol13G0308400 [Rhododendron molle]
MVKEVAGSSRGKGKVDETSSRREIKENIEEESESESSEEETDEEEVPLESRTGQREKRARRRTPEEMDADAQLDWVTSIPNRGFKCERSVSRRSFFDQNEILNLLKDQRLKFWTRALRGYNKAGVIEFYQNLNMSEALTKGKIKSKVNKKNIVVDANLIANYLKYERPPADLVNYPRAEDTDSAVVQADMYTTVPRTGIPPHKPGLFKDLYIVVNQVLHYNLYPRGAENKPSRKSAEILYAFVHDDEFTADWAEFIFAQMVDFKGDTLNKARCPFPCMITQFLRDKGIEEGPYEKMEPLSPSIIDKSVLNRSKSHSKAVRAGTSAGPSASVSFDQSLWAVPDPKASEKSLMRKLCCQNIAIWNCLRKEKKERKKLARDVRELKHELNWHTQCIESTSTEKYEAPPRVEEADSEEEVLVGPGAAPGGQHNMPMLHFVVQKTPALGVSITLPDVIDNIVFQGRPHQDGPAYLPVVAILSLGSPVVMDFTPHSSLKMCTNTVIKDVEDKFPDGGAGDLETEKGLNGHHAFSVLLMPRSLLIFKDEAYSDYLHGIKDSAVQQHDGVVNAVERLKSHVAIQPLSGPENAFDTKKSGDVQTIHRLENRVSLTCRVVSRVHKNLFKF